MWNGLGEVVLTAQVTDRNLIPGASVLAPGIWWNSHSEDGRNINQIVRQDEADMGVACAFTTRRFCGYGVTIGRGNRQRDAA